MKQLFLLTLFSFCALFSRAQVFLETFDATTGTNLPAGWTQKNLDGLTVASNLSTLNFGTNAWISRNFTATPGNRFLNSTSWYTPAGISNDWVVTPQIAIPNAPHHFLTFNAACSNSGFPDGYIVKVSTTDTAVASFSTTLLTVAAENNYWTKRAIDLSAYAGQNIHIAIINNSNDGELLYLDSVMVSLLPMSDVAMLGISPTADSRPTYLQTGTGSSTITGTIRNLGYQNITTATIKYNDGTNTYSYSPTGLNIAPYATYNFTHSTPVTMATAGSKNYKVWAEVAGDANNANDSAATKYTGVSTFPKYTMTFEEGTGTWCGWCPRGTVYMDSMSELHHGEVTLIAVHNGDPMVVTDYDAGIGNFIGGYPSAMANREDEIDPSEMIAYYDAHKNDFGFVAVNATGSFSGSVFTVNSSVVPSTDLNGDYRVALVVTEDNVSGTAAGYNQTNYYSSSSQNISLPQDGINWQSLPNPVPASQMDYDHVARTIVGGFTGQASSLPASMITGTTYTAPVLTYTVPATQNAGFMQGYILVIRNSDGVVLNSSAAMGLALNVKDLNSNINSMVTYPNPTKANLNVNLELKTPSEVTYSVTNTLGQVVLTNEVSGLITGNNVFSINTSTLSAGKYILTVKSKDGQISNKFIVSE